MIKNIMSIDLEDYFCDLSYLKWNEFESRIDDNTNKILELLEKYNATATFFTVGHIAENHPELIEKIINHGHEIASHSHYHRDLRKLDAKMFEEDLRKSISVLEKISGEKVNGFRAPYYSINKNNFWVFDILRKYVKYDSSIFPVKTPLYGLPCAPRFTYQMSNTNPLKEQKDGKLLEIPPITMKIPIYGNLPIAGGFYLRVLPVYFIKTGIKKFNKQHASAMCYIHPHDIDPLRPRIQGVRSRAYWGIKNSMRKFETLLKEFNFCSVREKYLE